MGGPTRRRAEWFQATTIAGDRLTSVKGATGSGESSHKGPFTALQESLYLKLCLQGLWDVGAKAIMALKLPDLVTGKVLRVERLIRKLPPNDQALLYQPFGGVVHPGQKPNIAVESLGDLRIVILRGIL